ncbi:MAG: polyketide cyclase [Candidatus Hydrogenedens sp.]|nr:polyketide cyclase [Candidatus Hydrogenedens sp.]
MANPEHELVLNRTINATPDKLYRCWTDPELMKQWFVPRPWTIGEVQTELRPGGSSLIVMRDPDGNEYPNRGVYLEVVPNERLVFTDAYIEAWVPSGKPFFTAIVTFEDNGDGTTNYTARARHWTAEDCAQHEAMGFQEGWGKCADQLEELAQTL